MNSIEISLYIFETEQKTVHAEKKQMDNVCTVFIAEHIVPELMHY
jgi:hypothetical protein